MGVVIRLPSHAKLLPETMSRKNLNLCLSIAIDKHILKSSSWNRQTYIQVSKGAKIRNRYNQVPHLTQDTNGNVKSSSWNRQAYIEILFLDIVSGNSFERIYFCNCLAFWHQNLYGYSAHE